MNAQMLTLMMKNQQLQQQTDRQARQRAPGGGGAAAGGYYYRPPRPTPTADVRPGSARRARPREEGPAAPASTPEPVGEMPGAALDPLEGAQTPEWHEPESLAPELPSRYLSVRQKEVIADTLRAHGRHMVKIESSYGDAESREFAEELGGGVHCGGLGCAGDRCTPGAAAGVGGHGIGGELPAAAGDAGGV